MNNSSTKSPPPSPSKHRVKGSYIATAAMFLIVVFMWRDMRNLKIEQVELTEQNTKLRAGLEEAKSELAKATEDLDFFKSRASASLTKKQDTNRPSAKSHPGEEPATLILQAPVVTSSSAGLVAQISFEPTASASADLVALVVRLPADSDAVILELGPVNDAAYSNVKRRVDGSGKFAIFQGVPADLQAIKFNLTVSGPVTATVRGSKGIVPFEIDINADAPNVRKL